MPVLLSDHLKMIILPAMLLLVASAASAQESPIPGLKLIHRAEMAVDPQVRPFTMIHGVLNFAPATRFPEHHHGGLTLYAIIRGSVVVERASASTTHEAGGSYIQKTGEVLAARNDGSEESLMSVAFVLPEGKELTIFSDVKTTGEPRPAPNMIHNLASEPLTMSTPFTVIQMVLDLDPETSTPVHSHPGLSIVTVLQGEVALRRDGGDERTFRAGEGWIVDAHQQIALSNRGDVTARFVGSYLLAQGEELTLVRQ